MLDWSYCLTPTSCIGSLRFSVWQISIENSPAFAVIPGGGIISAGTEKKEAGVHSNPSSYLSPTLSTFWSPFLVLFSGPHWAVDAEPRGWRVFLASTVCWNSGERCALTRTNLSNWERKWERTRQRKLWKNDISLPFPTEIKDLRERRGYHISGTSDIRSNTSLSLFTSFMRLFLCVSAEEDVSP